MAKTPAARPDTKFGRDKIDSRAKAFAAARTLDELKARDIVILDVKDITAFADYFVICTGDTKRHLRGLAKKMEETAADQGFGVHHAEGAGLARWILVDMNNVIVHIFDEETRAFYELERLWGDAARVAFQP